MPNAAPEQTEGMGASADADRAASPAGLSPEGGSSQVASHGASFTPGPWMRDGISVTICAPAGQPRRCIAITHPNIKVGAGESYRSMVANARLIAAAPDLYEALAELLSSRGAGYEVVGKHPIDGHPLNAEGVAAVKAAAALAKARGQ